MIYDNTVRVYQIARIFFVVVL